MYSGHVECCPIVSPVENATCVRLTLGKKDAACPTKVGKRWNRHTDGRQTDALRLSLDAVSEIVYFIHL